MKKRGKMKSTISILTMLTAFLFLFAICGYAEEGGSVQTEEAASDPGAELSLELASLTIAPEPVTIDCDQSVLLTALVSSGGEVAWSSSDEKVASVSDNGDGTVTVTGVGGGNATITCSAGEQTRTFEVTVNTPETLQIRDVEYPSTLQIAQGWPIGGGTITSVSDLKPLTSLIRAENGELVGEPYTQGFDNGVTYFEVAGINEQVPFSQIQTEGTYTWILVADDVSGRSVTLTLPIRVVSSEETVVSVAPNVSAPIITMPDDPGAKSGIEVHTGEKRTVAATLLKGSGTSSDLMWISYDPNIVTVSSSGEITGVGIGSTTIICKARDNSISSAGWTVTVREGDVASLTDGSYTPGADSMERWAKRGPLSVTTGEDGVAILDWQANPVLDWNAADTSSVRFSELRGREVTISLDIRSDDADLLDNTMRENGGGFLIDIGIGAEPGIRQRWIFLDQISYPRLSTEWQHISTTLTLTDDAFTEVGDPAFVADDNSWVYMTITNRSVFRMQVRNLKLEIGSGAAD